MFDVPCDNLLASGFEVIDQFLEESDYFSLLDYSKSLFDQGQFKPARIGQSSQPNDNVRRDHIFWLDEDSVHPSLEPYLEKLHRLKNHLNATLFLGLMEQEAHFAAYPPNSFYKKHIDQFQTKKERRISCVYYLNEQWDASLGGELKLYSTQDENLTTIQPLGNRFVYFMSDLPHEVCTAHKMRYSIAAWLKVRSLALFAAA